VGALFTPAPWKLIRDAALLSQDWPGIPHPLRGEIKEKTTVCTLCAAGCALRAKCVGDQPIAVAGVGGGLCAIGVTAHQLPYWPDRVKHGPVEEAKAAVARLKAEDKVAVLDLRPGRTASGLYRKAMAARPDGVYLAPKQPEVAINPAAAKTVVSVGAPLLDGWIAPTKAFAARGGFKLIQIEREFSRTAALADEWLPEGDAATIARRAEGPVLVIGRTMTAEIIALNKELGGQGKTIMALPSAGGVTLQDVPDGSIKLLYIDESNPGAYIPWPLIEPKLAKDAVTIAFAWSREGYARHATFVLPAAVFSEALDDVPNGGATTPLLKAPEWTVDPVEFIAKANLAEAMKERAASTLPEGFHAVNPETAWIGPMSSKLSRESSLQLAPGQVAVNPSSGLAEKSRGFLQTGRGKVAVQIVHDATIPPGGLRFLPTPDILDICSNEEPKVVTA
jgi:anaerobic selenocysteine-containing dehydrogenase